MREIRLEYGQTNLTASHVIHSCVIFVIFSIGRRNDGNNGFLAGVPLLPPPSRVLIPFLFPFERLPRRLGLSRRDGKVYFALFI